MIGISGTEETLGLAQRADNVVCEFARGRWIETIAILSVFLDQQVRLWPDLPEIEIVSLGSLRDVD